VAAGWVAVWPGPEIVSILSNLPVTMNNHQGGVDPATFAANPLLSGTFNIVSTNQDR
jgi:hypothetical protein